MAAPPHNTFGFASLPHSSHHFPGFLQPVINQMALGIQGEGSKLYWKCFFFYLCTFSTYEKRSLRRAICLIPCVLWQCCSGGQLFIGTNSARIGDCIVPMLAVLTKQWQEKPLYVLFQPLYSSVECRGLFVLQTQFLVCGSFDVVKLLTHDKHIFHLAYMFPGIPESAKLNI